MDAWLVHGGRLDAARIAFPHAQRPWIDLSTGINPWPWDVAAAGPTDWTRLPDVAGLAALEGAAAVAFGTVPGRVCAVPGSELGLRLLAAMALPRPYRHVTPGYLTHAEALDDSRPIADEALEEEAGTGGTILIANPSNPDGRLHDRASLLGVAARLGRAGGLLAVDEAFGDIALGASLCADAPENVIVLRSFGKFFGLPGVRLGFMVAAPALLARVRARLGSWPVSAAAIAIGTAAYRDQLWIDATRRRLASEAAMLDALLAGHGLEADGACPLFRLIRTPDAAALFRRLAGAGILTRPFVDRPDRLRIGLPADAIGRKRLDRALARG